MLQTILVSAVTELPAWILVSIGMFMGLRIIRFPDLTVEASFVAGTVGAAVGATQFSSSVAGLALAMIMGAFAAFLTFLLYSLHRTPMFKLLSSVLVVFAFYSINFRVLGNKAQETFSQYPTAFNTLIEHEANAGLNSVRPYSTLVGYVVAVVVVVAFTFLLKSRHGLAFRSVGIRPNVLTSCGVNPDWYVLSGLVLANVVIGIGGWLFSTANGSASIALSGTVIHALAAVILGETVVDALPFWKQRTVSTAALVVTPVVGACFYQILRASAIFMMSNVSERTGEGTYVRQEDLNLVFAVLLALIILLARLRSFTKGGAFDDLTEAEGF